jgi:hypothetical protein
LDNLASSRGALVTRIRLRLVAVGVGFFLALVELGFAAYSAVWVLTLPPPGGVGTTVFSFPRYAALLPPGLLLLSCLIGALVLYRMTRGQSRWSWPVAALTPVAALLAAYRPQLGVYGFRAEENGLPWANVLGFEQVVLIYGLQLGLYVAVAAYLVVIALSFSTRPGGSAVPTFSGQPLSTPVE